MAAQQHVGFYRERERESEIDKSSKYTLPKHTHTHTHTNTAQLPVKIVRGTHPPNAQK